MADGCYIVVQSEDEEKNEFERKLEKGQNGGGEEERTKLYSEYREGDYYEYIANSASLRPICVTEDVNLNGRSVLGKLSWWVATLLKFLSIIILSVRTDRLSEPIYLSSHWKHYGGMLIFSLLAWSPQVLHSLGFITFFLPPNTAYTICTFGLFYYILSITLFFWVLGPKLRGSYGKAKTLKLWEYFVSVAWQVQTLGFWALTISPAPYQYQLESVPHGLTTTLGLLLVIFGIGSKMGAIYGTGYNTYYWYDMITDIPNAHFVEVGIYKWNGSPTYTLGRGTSFGAALHYRSVPLLAASVADLVLINLFNRFVEQPFVMKMYLSNN